MSNRGPSPQTPGPWHVVPDESSGAWLCALDGLPVGYMEHLADAQFIAAVVQQALAVEKETS